MDALKKNMIIIMSNIPNNHPTKMDVLPKTFAQIFLAVKWLGRHSSTFSKTTATTFAFSSVFILFLWFILYKPRSRTVGTLAAFLGSKLRIQ